MKVLCYHHNSYIKSEMGDGGTMTFSVANFFYCRNIVKKCVFFYQIVIFLLKIKFIKLSKLATLKTLRAPFANDVISALER